MSRLYLSSSRTVLDTHLLSHENWHDRKNGLNRLRCVARNKCRQLIAGSVSDPAGFCNFNHGQCTNPFGNQHIGLSVMSISLNSKPIFD